MRAPPGISDFGDAWLFLDDDLGVPGNASALHRGQTQSFIERVGVEWLGPPEHSCHALDHCTDHVVVWILRRRFMGSKLIIHSFTCLSLIIYDLSWPFKWLKCIWRHFKDFQTTANTYLFSERPAGGLAVCAEEERLGVLGLEVLLNERGP